MGNNREYKSDLFALLMAEQEFALDVYNALNGTDYDDPSLVLITTIEKGVALSVHNDASFIIDNRLNMYEHQSTYNANMPLRNLIYIVAVIRDWLELNDEDLFSRRKIMLPIPHFVVFYNGEENRPEKEVLRLSDSYEPTCDEPELELVCTVYNINASNNESIKKQSRVLRGYMQFVDKVREYISDKVNSLEAAIDKAIDYCIDNDILAEFMAKRRNEVKNVTVLDMTFERREHIFRREEREEGRQEERKRLNALIVELSKQGRLEDLKRSAEDEEYQQRLFEEFHI